MEVAKSDLSFSSYKKLNKYRNLEEKVITLNSDQNYEFHWCKMKKRRKAGARFLILS